MYLSHPKSPFAACRGVPSSVHPWPSKCTGRPIPAGNHAVPASGMVPSLLSSFRAPSRSQAQTCITQELRETRLHGTQSDCHAWTQGRGLYFTCRSAVTARRAGPRYSFFLTRRCQNAAAGGEIARIEGVTWGPFNGATKLKYSPRPVPDVNRISRAYKKRLPSQQSLWKSNMRFYAASGFGWCFFFSPQFRNTIQSGLAMKIDE